MSQSRDRRNGNQRRSKADRWACRHPRSRHGDEIGVERVCLEQDLLARKLPAVHSETETSPTLEIRLAS